MPKQKFITHPEGFKEVMPNNFSPTPASSVPPKYERYPLTLHRGQWPTIESRKASSPEDEQEALDAGWSTLCPKIPPPEEPKPALTLEDRVAALEEWREKSGKRSK